MSTFVDIGLSNVMMAAMLALLAAAVGRCCRRPALTHGLWVLVLIKLVTPPLVPLPVTLVLPTAEVKQALAAEASAAFKERELPIQDLTKGTETPLGRQPNFASADEPGAASDPALPLRRIGPEMLPRALEPTAVSEEEAPAPGAWQNVLGGIWLAGSALYLIMTALRVRRFQRWFRNAAPAPAVLQRRTAQLAGRFRVRCPEVWLVPGVLSPMLWVMGRQRRLVLPESLLPRLSEEQRDTLLSHELAHLRRGDPFIRYLEILVFGLYWWCPLVWWARTSLREAEEECCDAWVVWALPGSARSYALALVETVDFLADARAALPALASGFGHVQTLRRRLTMIMRGTTPRSLTASGAFVLLGVGVLMMPLLPTWAQEANLGDPNTEESVRQQPADDANAKDLERQIEKLRADIVAREKTLKRAQAQMTALHKKLQAALARLNVQMKQGSQAPPLPPPGAGKVAYKPIDLGFPVRYLIGPNTAVPRALYAVRPDLERRLDQLERKLADTLRELKELRRELGHPRSQAPVPPGPSYILPAPRPGNVPNPPPPLGYVMPLQTNP